MGIRGIWTVAAGGFFGNCYRFAANFLPDLVRERRRALIVNFPRGGGNCGNCLPTQLLALSRRFNNFVYEKFSMNV